MNDEQLIADAYARRDKALSEAQRWSSFIDMMCELRPNLRRLDTVTRSEARVEPGRPKEGGSPGPRTMAITETAAIEAIRRAGRYLHTRELLPLIEASGVEVGGKDPAATLSARLSRSERLANNRAHGWAVVEDQAPRSAMEAAFDDLDGPLEGTVSPEPEQSSGPAEGGDQR